MEGRTRGLQRAVGVERLAADGTGLRRLVGGRHERLEPAAPHFDVVVQQHDELAARNRAAEVVPARDTAVHAGFHDLRALDALAHQPDDPLGRAVEHDDDLERDRGTGIPRKRLQAAGKQCDVAVRGDDDRRARLRTGR